MQVPYNAEGLPFGEWKGVEAAMEAFHLAAVEFQLAQLASAAHIAIALNRTLIFPKVPIACFWPQVLAMLVYSGGQQHGGALTKP